MLRPTSVERRADSKAFRRSHHVEKETKSMRFAGELFGIEKKNKEVRPSGNPRGLGFADKDKFGPDDNWDTKDPLNSTHDPTYYRKY